MGVAGLSGCLDSLDPGEGEDGGDGEDGTDGDNDSDGGDGEDGDDELQPVGVEEGYEVRLGTLMATSGDLASVGRPIENGAVLPVAQLEGSMIEIDHQAEDTQTDPQAGISAAESLVNAGYPMVNGANASNVNLQVAQNVFIPNQVVGCSPSSTSPAVTTLEDDGFIFRTCPSDDLQGQVLASVANEDLAAETTSTLHLNDDYGQALSDTYVSEFEGEVLSEVSFEPEQPSYTSRLEEALGDDPDTLMLVGFPQSGIQLFRDYYSDFDTGVDILITDGLRDATLPGEVGNPLNNVIGTAPSASGPDRDAFDELFEDEYGSEPGVFTAQAYDSSAVMILANVAAGENDGGAIRDYMPAVANPDGEEVGPGNLEEAVEIVAGGDPVNYQGASSTVDFDENGDMRAVTFEVFEFVDDGVEVMDTIDFETDE